MNKRLARLRGSIGMGLTWAVMWAPLGAITGAVLGMPLGRMTANYAALFAVLGFMGGTIFSTVFSLADGRRSFDELSLSRFTAWGALGGILLGGAVAVLLGSGFTTFGAVIAGATAILDAGSAAGSLLIARAANRRSLSPGGGAALLGGDRVRQGLAE